MGAGMNIDTGNGALGSDGLIQVSPQEPRAAVHALCARLGPTRQDQVCMPQCALASVKKSPPAKSANLKAEYAIQSRLAQSI
jgi:hypothetical protein